MYTTKGNSKSALRDNVPDDMNEEATNPPKRLKVTVLDNEDKVAILRFALFVNDSILIQWYNMYVYLFFILLGPYNKSSKTGQECWKKGRQSGEDAPENYGNNGCETRCG